MVITSLTPYFHNYVMSEWTLDWPLPHFAVYKDQLMPLGIILGDLDSAIKAFADLKTELDSEKASRKAAQIEVDTFAAQIPTLEDKVKYLKNKVVDGLAEVRAWELYLERTTWANDNYEKQNTQLSKKLESKSLSRIRTLYHTWTIFWLTSLWLVELDAELNTLKAMVDNAVAFFYPGESSEVRAP
jgi:chromosome segregation ATPase